MIRPLGCVQADFSAPPLPASLLICRLVVLITCNGCHAASPCWAFACAVPLTRIPSPLLITPALSSFKSQVKWQLSWEASCKSQTEFPPLCSHSDREHIQRGGTQAVWTPAASATPLLCSSVVGRLFLLSLNLQPQPVTEAQQMPADGGKSMAIHLFLRQ